MSSHLTMIANPCAAFSRASTCIFEIASSSNADEWGTLVTAAPITSGFQSRPTETGHPTRAYCIKTFAAGCHLTLHLGNTRPHNFPSMTPSGTVKSPSNCRRSSANAVADLFLHQCRGTLYFFGAGCTATANALNSRFFSGLRRVKSARPTCVLNSMLGIADWRSD